VGRHPGQCLHQPDCGGVSAVAFTQVGRGGDEEVFDLLDGGGAGFDRASAGDQQGFEGAGVGVFGHGQSVAG